MFKDNKKSLGIIVIVVIAIVYLLNKGTAGNSSSQLVIGVLTPLTGSEAIHGEFVKNGIELAKGEFDNKNIKLVYEDSMCDPKTAVSGFNKLVTQDKAKIVIGLLCSGDALAVNPIAQEKKILLVASTASSPKLTDAGDYFFRVYPSSLDDADFISDYIVKNNFKKVALAAINNDYGSGISQEIVKMLGDKIFVNEQFKAGETDFRTFLSKAKKEADIIVLVGYPDNTPIFLKQKMELQLKQQVIGSSGTFSAELFAVGSATNSFYFSGTEVSSSFGQKYKDKFKTDSVYPSEYGYDTFLSLFEAIKNSGSLNVDKIKDSLYAVNVVGASGNIQFDKNGDRKGANFKIYKINQDKQVVSVPQN